MVSVCLPSDALLNVLLSYTSEVRGSGREEVLHVQGAAAALEQEGRDELLHIQGQEGQL